jgi:hypothetical protein
MPMSARELFFFGAGTGRMMVVGLATHRQAARRRLANLARLYPIMCAERTRAIVSRRRP